MSDFLRNSKIEVAPAEYRIKCSYDEAVLYCFQLEIDGKTGWRLPTEEEYYSYDVIPNSWYLNDPSHRRSIYRVSPVRDIK